MGRLKIIQIGFMDTNRLLKLLYVLSAPLTESRLGLPVPLLALL